MALRPVLVIPDQRLRQVAKPVKTIDNSVQSLIDDMFETMHHEEGCGLAAPQIGVGLRVIVMDTSQDIENGLVLALINPVIVDKSKDNQVFKEGCLSVPDQSAQVKRSREIIVEYLDREGKKQTLVASDFTATCLQHEIDHLNGKLYIDYLSPLKRNIIINRVNQNYS
ncbi:MAG: peptide deformylase [Candidatus Puniceispirillum sp.]|nr:peptide deformylase [Candidatus Pelagibacter sp.]MBA4282674.1 peptide deformylase [Candidatus Puniceispirillum sp.]